MDIPLIEQVKIQAQVSWFRSSEPPRQNWARSEPTPLSERRSETCIASMARSGGGSREPMTSGRRWLQPGTGSLPGTPWITR
jgi:hypothetical protein